MAYEGNMKIEIPRRVEEVWESSPDLPLPQRLNTAFESISVSSFPQIQGEVIEIASDASIAEAVQVLAKNNAFSAAVRDVDAPDDASWIDRYLGIVEFAGIILWLLQKSKVISSSDGISGVPAIALAASFGVSTSFKGRNEEQDAADSLDGDFLEELTSSPSYQQGKVKDIVGSFRWAPFLPVQKSDSLLTVLLLLSNYHMKYLPVVESGQAKIENIITQTSVLHVLTCLPWFDTLGKLSLAKLGLPLTTASKLITIEEGEPVVKAFELMGFHGIGGLPVVSKYGKKPIGNISIRDVKFLLTAPKLYNSHRRITAKDFLEVTRSYLERDEPSSPILKPVIVCTSDATLEQVISKLNRAGIHRIYVVNRSGNLEGVVTLRDIIAKFVYEPPGYFGDFFAGVVPAKTSAAA